MAAPAGSKCRGASAWAPEWVDRVRRETFTGHPSANTQVRSRPKGVSPGQTGRSGRKGWEIS